jgi:HEAT repeat protein
MRSPLLGCCVVALAVAPVWGQLPPSPIPVPPSALIDRLDDPDPAARRAAIAGLSRLGADAEPAVPRLIIALKDPATRRDAVGALAQIGRTAVPALAQALGDTALAVRLGAAQALAEIGPDAKQAVQPLITALADPAVRRDAVEALAAIGPDALVSLLGALADDQEPIYTSAIAALGKIGKKSDAATSELVRLLGERNEKTRVRAAQALALIGPAAKPAQPDILKFLAAPSSSVRAAAVGALESIGGPEINAPLVKVATTDTDLMVREVARRSLARIGAPAVNDVVAAMKSEDPGVRLAVAQALGAMGPEARASVGPLVELLKDKEDRIRVAAIVALGDIGPDSQGAVGPLVPLLIDRNEDVRRASLEAFGRIGPQSAGAVPEIAKVLGDNPLRLTAVRTLGLIGPNSGAAVPALLPLLKISDPETRRTVVEALGRIGPAAKPAVPDLLLALHSEFPNLRAVAAEALGRIGPEPEVAANLIRALADADPRVADAAGEALARFGPPIVPQLVLAFSDKATARAAAAALVRINQPAAAELIASLKIEASRPYAAWALTRLTPEYLPNLVNVLRDETPPQVPASVVAAILAERGETVVPMLVQMIRDASPRVRAAGVGALARFGWRSDTLAADLQKLLADGDKNVRMSAAEALSRIGPRGEAAVGDLIVRLKDPDTDVRRSTAEALGRYTAPEVPTRLIEVAALDVDRTVRAAAADSLVRLGPASVTPLTTVLKEPDPRFRQAAASVLGRLGPDAAPAVPGLAELLADEREPMRLEAASALAAIGPAAAPAAPRLVAALNDTSESVRFAALTALRRAKAGQVQDLPALRKALVAHSELVSSAAAQAIAGLLTRLQPDLKSLPADQAKQLSTELTELSKDLSRVGGNDVLQLQATQMQKTLGVGPSAAGEAKSPGELAANPGETPAAPTWVKWLAIAAAYVAVMVGLWVLLLIVAPISLLMIDRFASVLRWPLLLGSFRYHGRVLDAWVARHSLAAADNFQKQPTVSDRARHVAVPLKINGVVAGASPEQLRPVMDRPRSWVVIHGEAGSGRTSLACQIARWVLRGDTAKRMGSPGAIPVLIEHDMIGGEKNQQLVDAVEAKLRAQLGNPAGLSRPLLKQLLKKRRVLVIVDAVDHMNDKSRAEVRASIAQDTMNMVVVTSGEVEDLGAPAAHVQTLPVPADQLAMFLDDYLRQRGVRERFGDAEWPGLLVGLSNLLQGGGGSAAVVKMYADLMIAAKLEAREQPAPRSLPELILAHMKGLKQSGEDMEWRDPAAVLRDCKIAAWECTKVKFRPETANRVELQTVLAGGAMLRQVIDKRLKQLESQGVLQFTGPDQTRVRYSVGLLCEHLAAAHVIDLLETNAARWQALLSQVDAAKPSRGFLLALREWAAANPAKIAPGVVEALTNRLVVAAN